MVCDTGTGDGHPYPRLQLPGTGRASTLGAPNHSKAASKSAPELSFPAYSRGSRRAALASAAPISWQVFPLTRWGGHQQRAACTTPRAQQRATALHTRGWRDVAVIALSWTAPPAWPLYDVHKVVPYAVSWTLLRWKQSTHSQLEPSSSNSKVSVMNLTTGHFLKVTCKLFFLVFFIVVQNEDMKGFTRSTHTHTHLLFVLKHKISPPSVVQEGSGSSSGSKRAPALP